MRIAVCCATRRGRLCLERVADLAPEAALDVFSFREEPHEPPFLAGIKDVADRRGATFHEARQLGRKSLTGFWDATPVDLMLVVGWRYMIPPRVYERARLGAFVLHDSLLPAYRGFAPTVWAIRNGEDHTGATLFRIAETVDSGEIVDQVRVPIGPDEMIGEVMESVTGAYLDLLDRNLAALLEGEAETRPQDASKATFTCKLLPADDAIDWSRSTREIHDLVRAVTHPYPGAHTTLDGRRLTIWAARRPEEGKTWVGRVPGRVVEFRPGAGAVVLTGDGSLLVREVQLEGEEPCDASEILTSLAMTLGR